MPDVVSNTGPLIALAGIRQFDLLHELFHRILIPPAVQLEVLDETTLKAITAADWITVQGVQDTIAVQLLQEDLGAGESEAIVLARELDAGLLLIDERTARRKAHTLGLSVVGTLGVLLIAKEKGLIAAIQPLLDELRRAGFRMSDDLYFQVLRHADEVIKGQ